MPYMPLKSVPSPARKNVTGTMPIFGMNLKKDSQLLDTRYALLIENYLVHDVAKMQKRPGQTQNFDTGDSDPVEVSGEFIDGFDIIAYGQKVRAYNTADGTFVNIKTDFTVSNSGFTGGRYGDFFFVNTLEDGLWRIAKTGAATFSITNVAAAGNGDIFRILGKRAFLGNLSTNGSGWKYSDSDLGGATTPFTDWTSAAGYNAPGAGGYRNGGDIRDSALLGNNIFVGQENGWHAFSIEQTDLGGVSSKFDKVIQVQENFPVYRCKVTEIGMIVVSSSGVWRLISLGQPNIAFSDQWELLTGDLGEDYFNDVNFDNVDIMYDSQRGFIYVTLAKNSDTNDTVLAVKVAFPGTENVVKIGATSILTGWNVLTFMTRGNDILGTSAIDGIRHNLFVGQKDGDSSIHSEYVQELKIALTEAFDLEEFYAKMEMSPASEITVSFDTFDETHYFEERRWVSDVHTPRYAYPGNNDGWGSQGFGAGGWGGGSLASGLIPDFFGAKPGIRRISRLRLRFESDDFAEHIINFFSVNVRITKQIRNRQLVKADS